MGNIFYNVQVNPNEQSYKGVSLFSTGKEVSRVNFKFIRKISTSGI